MDTLQIIPKLDPAVFSLWETKALVEVRDETGTTTQMIHHESTRIIFGYVIFAGSNKFGYVHYKYRNYQATLFIEIYAITKHTYLKESTFSIECGYTCNNVNGNLCKINEFTFNVILGDLGNEENISVIQFTSRSAVKLTDVTWSYRDSDLQYGYFFDTATLLRSNIIGFETNKFGVRVDNLATRSVFGRQIIVHSTYSHQFLLPTEIESEIIEISQRTWCLIYLKNLKATDAKKYELLILFDLLTGNVLEWKEYDKTYQFAYTINFKNAAPSIGYLTVG